MFELRPVTRGVALAVGGLVAVITSLPAGAQQQQPQPPSQQLERVEITGSAIRRVPQEGPAPVEVYTRKDIERTGATSINELIRSIPSIDIFDQGELASNSPAGSGTANLRLRGLDDSNLLVLLNGRRLPVNALYDSSGAGAAVDINMIPVSAIERVEILKDGGSAIYGADAVAGVVNIITKKDYQGIEARAGYGISRENDGKEQTFGLSAGFGDLASDRFNVLVAIDYFKRDPILRKDRELTRSVDGRRFGAPDGRSFFAPTGNIVDPLTGAAVLQTYKPCPPENFNVFCRYDFNASLLTSYNGADRLSGLGIASVQLTPDVRAFLEATYSKTEDTFLAHPVPDFFNVPIIDPSQAAFEDPTVPGTVVIGGRFMQGGPRTTNRESKLTNFAAGAEGSSFGLDWKLNASQGKSEVTNSDSNYYNRNLWVPATVSGQLDPTVGTNDPAFVEGLKVRPVRIGESTITTVNGQIGGEAFRLPAGPLMYAVGASWWKEELTDTPDALTQQGLVIGSIQQAAVKADRKANAYFGELAVPIISGLEAQLAVRRDEYPTESKTSPKVGLKYQVVQPLLLRASYTESFRAPVLKQLFGAQEQGAVTITNPELCQILVPGFTGTCNINAFQVNGSNPNLKSETGETINFGAVFDITQNFSGSVDFWRIRKEDDISSPTLNSAIRQGLFGRDPLQPARILIFTNLQNIATRVTSGVDLDFRFRVPGTALGTITVRNLTSLLHQNKTQQLGSDYAEFVGTYATPNWRNALIGTAEKGPWTTQLTLRSVGGFWDQDDPWPIASGVRKVGSHEELDVQLEYAGVRNLRLIGGVKNLLNNLPPFSRTNLTDNQYTQMGFAELYTARGQFFYVNAIYRFR